MGKQVEWVPKQAWLVIKRTSFDKSVDLLQTNEIRLLMVDAIDYSLQGVPSISTTNAFMNVPGQEPHWWFISSHSIVLAYKHKTIFSNAPCTIRMAFSILCDTPAEKKHLLLHPVIIQFLDLSQALARVWMCLGDVSVLLPTMILQSSECLCHWRILSCLCWCGGQWSGCHCNHGFHKVSTWNEKSRVNSLFLALFL